MIFKAKHVQHGGHITVTIFSAISINHTFGNLGSITMDERDFDSFKRSVKSSPAGPDTWVFEERVVESGDRS